MTDSHPLPTKTVVKKYRGQEYQETIVDWTALQQIDRQKPRRKYRGQYIDWHGAIAIYSVISGEVNSTVNWFGDVSLAASSIPGLNLAAILSRWLIK